MRLSESNNNFKGWSVKQISPKKIRFTHNESRLLAYLDFHPYDRGYNGDKEYKVDLVPGNPYYEFIKISFVSKFDKDEVSTKLLNYIDKPIQDCFESIIDSRWPFGFLIPEKAESTRDELARNLKRSLSKVFDKVRVETV